MVKGILGLPGCMFHTIALAFLITFATASLQADDTPAPRRTSPPTSLVHNAREIPNTRTLTPATTVQDVQEDATSTASSTASYRLETATKPIPLAATIGLIMPDPWQSIYVGENYSFGFVDAVPRPAPTIGGWLRQVQPLLIMPDYKVDIFPSTGTADPESAAAVPFGSDGLCGASAEDYAISYPFTFLQPGWYIFVINQTWFQANVSSDHKCLSTVLDQKSFFASQILSVAAAPTYSTSMAQPDRPNTVFASVTWQTPGTLPYDHKRASAGDKLAVGLGVTAAVIALMAIGATVWWVRKRRRYQAELLAFNRLSTADKASFLAENPDHWLNPNRGGMSRRTDPNRPPPPGTMAYTQWYWNQAWKSEQERQMAYGQIPGGVPVHDQSYAPMGGGVGSRPIMAQAGGYGYPVAIGMGMGPPVPPKGW